MFRLNIKSGERKIVYKPSSIAVKFLIEGKKFKESLASIERIFNVDISEVQRATFLKDGNQIRMAKPDGKPDEIAILKIKLNESFNVDYFRNTVAGFIQQISSEEVHYLHIFIPKYEIFKDYFNDEIYFYQTFIEGIYYGDYSFRRYKSDKEKEKDLTVLLHADDEVKLHYSITNAVKIMSGVTLTRDLENEPGSGLTPPVFAERIYDALSNDNVSVTIWDEKEIKRKKMGGLLSVGSGSDNPPRFIIIDYTPAGKSRKFKTVALVGKGITFDAGGISIKPAAEMGDMKADMSGAAVVAGVIYAASRMKMPLHLIGIIPAAENLLSGKSYRPGDIIRTASGKTVEVDNTDAEGRIILADALNYASEQEPDYIIDLATLTGACVVALGPFTAGLFTNNKFLREAVFTSGQKTYERVWELPLWQEYGDLIKSDVADIKNLGGKWGGAITAAKFLEHFVEPEIPWAHLDIAGPTFPAKMKNYDKKFMSGFGVRLIIETLNKIRNG